MYAMRLMLQQPEPEDYVVATSENHSVREFLDLVSDVVNIDLMKYVEIDEKLFRPADVNLLVGDASKARTKLGWKPSISFEELVKGMVESDLKYFREAKRLPIEVR